MTTHCKPYINTHNVHNSNGSARFAGIGGNPPHDKTITVIGPVPYQLDDVARAKMEAAFFEESIDVSTPPMCISYVGNCKQVGLSHRVVTDTAATLRDTLVEDVRVLPKNRVLLQLLDCVNEMLSDNIAGSVLLLYVEPGRCVDAQLCQVVQKTTQHIMVSYTLRSDLVEMRETKMQMYNYGTDESAYDYDEFWEL